MCVECVLWYFFIMWIHPTVHCSTETLPPPLLKDNGGLHLCLFKICWNSYAEKCLSRLAFLSLSTFFSRSNTIPCLLTPKVLPDETQCIFRGQQILASILTSQLLKGACLGWLWWYCILYVYIFSCFVKTSGGIWEKCCKTALKKHFSVLQCG